MEPIKLVIGNELVEPRAHVRGTYGWHLESVTAHSWVWSMMTAAGIEKVRLSRCMDGNAIPAVRMLIDAGLLPVLCLDSADITQYANPSQRVYDVLRGILAAFPRWDGLTLEYWNEPPSYWNGTQRQFWDHCAAVALAVDEVEQAAGVKLRIGGPSCGPRYPGWWGAWVNHTMGVNASIRADFDAVHWYEADGYTPPENPVLRPVLCTEFNLDGAGLDARMDTDEGAIWLLNRLWRLSHKVEWYISGAWGQLETHPDGGKLGLCIVGDGKRRTRPQYDAVRLWNMLGNQSRRITSPDEVPPHLCAVADELGQVLAWNDGDEEVSFYLADDYRWQGYPTPRTWVGGGQRMVWTLGPRQFALVQPYAREAAA